MTSRTAALTGGDTGASGLPRRVVVLGTGGTIAGTSARPGDHVGYTAAQRGIEELLGSLGPHLGAERLASLALEAEQVAQIDSKDMSHAVWRRLAERAAWHLARPEVVGVVVTHGTDTLEETAYLLHRVLALAGRVWAGAEVRKVHPYRLDAFDAGDAGPLAHIEQGALRRLRTWPAPGGPAAMGLQVLAADIWPEVQIVTSHAGADGRIVELLLDAGVQGLVVACTGNGSIHQALLAELLRAQQRGVLVLRALRQGSGRIVPGGASVLADAGSLTPSQARVELLLRLLAHQPG